MEVTNGNQENHQERNDHSESERTNEEESTDDSSGTEMVSVSNPEQPLIAERHMIYLCHSHALHVNSDDACMSHCSIRGWIKLVCVQAYIAMALCVCRIGQLSWFHINQ